jgi:hypothetical protein
LTVPDWLLTFPRYLCPLFYLSLGNSSVQY